MVMMVMAAMMPSLLASRDLLSIVASADHVDGMPVLVLVFDEKAEQTLGMETKTSANHDADEALVAVREGDERLRLVIEIDHIGKVSIVRRENQQEDVAESGG